MFEVQSGLAPVVISVVAIAIAVVSIVMASAMRLGWHGQNNPSAGSAMSQNSTAAEATTAKDYFMELKNQFGSMKERGELAEANVLQVQYEDEMRAWRALESLKRLAPRELGIVSEGFSEEEIQQLEQLVVMQQ